MKKNLMFGIIAVVILAGGGFMLASNRNNTSPDAAIIEQEVTAPENEIEDPEEDRMENEKDTAEEITDKDVKTFTISASSFKFTPAEIRVKKGDRVKIVINNTGGFHDWVIDEFNARTKQAQGPATETVEFTADKTGTFEYYCSVAQHRQNGMVGKLIVE